MHVGDPEEQIEKVAQAGICGMAVRSARKQYRHM